MYDFKKSIFRLNLRDMSAYQDASTESSAKVVFIEVICNLSSRTGRTKIRENNNMEKKKKELNSLPDDICELTPCSTQLTWHVTPTRF